MIPEVKFVYSFIYDKTIVEKFWIRHYDQEKCSERVSKYIEVLEPVWGKIEKKVLSELSIVSGLKWSERKIKCYVTTMSLYSSFADPLTISILNQAQYPKSVSIFIQTLIHELVHQLFTQQSDFKNNFAAAFNEIAKKYPYEKIYAKNHILLHALLKHIILKYFDEKTLKKEIERSKTFKSESYYRAWQIVEKDDYAKIISDFRKYLTT